jgi:hypothetical protein
VEPSLLDALRYAQVTIFTGIGYALATALFLPGWWLSARVRSEGPRVMIRAALVAASFTPTMFMDPGGLVSLVPAGLAMVGSGLLYGLSRQPPGFWFYQALSSFLMSWTVIMLAGALARALRSPASVESASRRQ